MSFRTLPPGLCQRILKHHEDVLTPAAEARDFATSLLSCPRCKNEMRNILYGEHVFRANDVLPRNVAQCTVCRYAIEPKTGLVVDTGNASLIPDEPDPIIRPSE